MANNWHRYSTRTVSKAAAIVIIAVLNTAPFTALGQTVGSGAAAQTSRPSDSASASPTDSNAADTSTTDQTPGTASEPAATSTKGTLDTNSNVTSADSTSTPIDSDRGTGTTASSTDDVVSSAGSDSTVSSTSTAPTPAPQESATTTLEGTPQGTATAQSVSALEESYFNAHGSYLQVLPNNALPIYQTGSVADLLGAPIPESARVDVYEGPEGKGYQILFEENGVRYSAGYGPEAANRTFAEPVYVPGATSTPATIEPIEKVPDTTSTTSATTGVE